MTEQKWEMDDLPSSLSSSSVCTPSSPKEEQWDRKKIKRKIQIPAPSKKFLPSNQQNQYQVMYQPSPNPQTPTQGWPKASWQLAQSTKCGHPLTWWCARLFPSHSLVWKRKREWSRREDTEVHGRLEHWRVSSFILPFSFPIQGEKKGEATEASKWMELGIFCWAAAWGDCLSWPHEMGHPFHQSLVNSRAPWQEYQNYVFPLPG